MIKKATPLLPSILLTLLLTSLSQSVRYEDNVADAPPKKYQPIKKPKYGEFFDERPGEKRFNDIRVAQQDQRLDSSPLGRSSQPLKRKIFSESPSKD
ncbi:hypothetical protein OAN21_02795 [Alphaproteobacteria bacterium]|nr:hypothetical protein [Alphaproteobacteria bacterium]